MNNVVIVINSNGTLEPALAAAKVAVYDPHMCPMMDQYRHESLLPLGIRGISDHGGAVRKMLRQQHLRVLAETTDSVQNPWIEATPLDPVDFAQPFTFKTTKVTLPRHLDNGAKITSARGLFTRK